MSNKHGQENGSTRKNRYSQRSESQQVFATSDRPKGKFKNFAVIAIRIILVLVWVLFLIVSLTVSAPFFWIVFFLGGAILLVAQFFPREFLQTLLDVIMDSIIDSLFK